MPTKHVDIDHTQLVVDRQALLTFVRYLDCNMGTATDLAKAMDKLREPFFNDELSSGTARTDFTVNQYT